MTALKPAPPANSRRPGVDLKCRSTEAPWVVANAMRFCTLATDNTSLAAGSPDSCVALAIDCPDAEVHERLRGFYAQALGGEVVSRFGPCAGVAAHLRHVSDYKPSTWASGETPKQLRFEWMVEDLDSAVARLQEMGATLAGCQRPEDAGLRMVLDEAEHYFCVAKVSGSSPAFRNEASKQHRWPSPRGRTSHDVLTISLLSAAKSAVCARSGRSR